MKIVQKVQDIWSGQESVKDGMTDRGTDGWMDRRKAINPASGRGITNTFLETFRNLNEAYNISSKTDVLIC